MKIVDARGDACPLPVIKAKKALKMSKGVVKVLVDNEIATQNLSKMAAQLGLTCQVYEKSVTDYEVLFNGVGEAIEEQIELTKPNVSETIAPYIVVFDSLQMGKGDTKLGKTLLKSLFYAYTEQDFLPDYLLFYNEGAYLTIEDSPVLDDLQLLAEKGVSILTCGACLDYYQLTKSLAVGEITNMYRIVELMSTYRMIKL